MGPGRYPQHTRANFGPEAVGSSKPQTHHEPKRETLQEGILSHGSGATDPQTQPSPRSCYATA